MTTLAVRAAAGFAAAFARIVSRRLQFALAAFFVGFAAQAVAQPTITSVSPGLVHYGATLDIKGTGFGTIGATSTTVTLTSTATTKTYTVTAPTDTEIQQAIGVLPSGYYTVKVAVTTPNGTLTSSAFSGVAVEAPAWSLQNPKPVASFVENVTYGAGIYVATSSTTPGVILTSTDAATWTVSYSANYGLRAVTYGNQLFVAVGDSGQILTSPDGLAWTLRTSSTTQQLYGVAFGAGKYVVLGFNSTVLTSTDGASWAVGSLGATGVTFQGLAYGGNVFVGVGYSGKIYTSADGVTWTSQNSGSASNLLEVTYAGSKFLAVGTGVITTSTDGVTWAVQTLPSGYTNATFYGAGYGGGRYDVVGANNILTSLDAVTWTVVPNLNVDIRGITYANNQWVGVGFPGQVYTSADGLTFTLRSGLTRRNFQDAVYGNGRYLAVGSSGTIAVSTDLQNWSVRENANGSFQSFRRAAYGAGEYVVVGTGGAILASTDAVSWSTKTSGTTQQINGIAYGNGKFVTVGNGGYIGRSADGLNWTASSAGSNTTNLYGIDYGAGVFVVVGSGGTIFRSTDGVNGSAVTSGTTTDLNSVAYGNGQFTAVGTGTILTSPDGITWTKRTAPSTSVVISDVVAAEGLYIATVESNTTTSLGNILVSADGANWDYFSIGANLLYQNGSTVQTGVAYGNGRFVLVSGGGELLSSQPLSDSFYLTSQPASQTIKKGDSVDLLVTAFFGTSTQTPPSLSYQWYRGASGDTTNPVGTNSAGYTTGALDGSARFWVRVTNNLTGRVVDSAEADLYGPPSVVQQPQAQVPASDTTAATLSVQALGNGPFNYQWKFNGAAIAGAVNSSFQIPLGAGAAGAYTVDVSNALGTTTSAPAVVTYTASAPTIATQPASQSTTASAGVGFSIVATGTGPLSYQWQFNGKNLVNTVNAVDGVNGPNLSIKHPQVADAGPYTCVVSNSLGSVTSAAATLSVSDAPPTITVQPTTTITLLEGQELTISLTATGTGPLQYQWQFNGAYLPGATSDTYDVPAITMAQAGWYTCVVSNPKAASNVGTASCAPVSVTVAPSAPQVVVAPNQMLAVYGTPTTTSVRVTGTAPMTYQWKKGDVAIPGATSPDLVIPSVDDSAVATYTVEITNARSTTKTTPVQLGIVNPSVAKSVLASPHDTPMNGVAYGAGKFVAVGNAGAIRTSKDGVAWTEQVAPGNFSLNSIAYANGQFVTVGSVQVFGTLESVGVLLTSSDGLNWTRQNLGDYVPTLYRVANVGGVWVAVGDYGEILTSADGVTWTARQSGTSATLEDVTYGKGTFLVSGYQVVLSSTDAATWSPVTTLPGSADFVSVAFGNGNFTITTADGGGGYTADLVTWTISGYNISDDPISRTLYAGGKWVGVSGTGNVYTSADAAVWTGVPVSSYGALQDIAYGNGTYVAVGQSGEVLSSADAVNWTSHRNSPLPAVSFRGVAASASTYVLVGDSGVIASSTDGWNWTQRTSGVSTSIMGVTYGGGRFVAVGQSGLVFTSTDGVFWTVTSLGFTGYLRAVTYDGVNYIAVGDSGRIYTSPDAATWTQQASNLTVALRSVASLNGTVVVGAQSGIILTAKTKSISTWTYQKLALAYPFTSAAGGNGVFVLGGIDNEASRSVVATSTDGATWALAYLPYSSSLNGLAFANGKFSSASGSSVVLSSTDGATWTPEFSGTTNLQTALTYGPAGYISVGSAGSVITFPATTAPSVTAVQTSTPYSGSTLTITGSHFTGATSVTIGGLAVTSFTVDSDTQITATVPLTAGSGAVLVTTAGGSNIVTPAAQVQIATLAAPTIVRQPLGVIAAIGDPVHFMVGASGVPEPTYQWNKDGSPIKGATDSSYTIPSATAADGGNYTCTVTNSQGTATSDAGPLALRPAITAQPVGLTALEGGQVSLSVTADGTGPLSYQWYKGDFAIQGANAATLTFSKISLDAAGVYSVTVSSQYGTASSRGVSLEVTPLPKPPSITTSPASLTANFGSTVNFSVEVAGTAPFTYVWKHGTTVLSATTGTLTLTGITAADAGDYTVTVSNDLGSATSAAAALSVNLPPSIVTAPTSRTVTAGDAATFTVKAAGTPELTYQWTRNGKAIDGATSATYTIGKTATTDTGTYTCTVANVAGTATTSATLTVNPAVQPPTITSSTSAAVAINTPFTYTIVATGLPTSYGASPLPAGLALNGNVISGTPTAAGTTAVKLTATNAGGTGDATLALTVVQPVPVVTSAARASGRVGDAFAYTITATNTATSYALAGDSKLPAGLTLNPNTGAISGTPTAAGTFVVNVTATNAAGASPAFPITISIAQSAAASVITSASSASGKVGVAFSYQLTANNAPTSYTVSELPAGLSIDSSGLISGTPTKAGTYTISASATNAAGAGPVLSIAIAIAPAATAPAITSSTAVTATAGTQFSYRITATNAPTSYGVTGTLPDGLFADGSSIGGTPTTPGDTVVTIAASNADGTGTAKLTISVVAGLSAPQISSSQKAAGKVGVAFAYATVASNAPTAFAAVNLPGGLAINADTGVISGTPTTAGTFTVTLTASNAAGTGAPYTVTIKIEPAATAPVITSSATATITAKQLFNYQITATNTPTSYSAINLPDGMTLDRLAGTIAGTTASTGLYNVVLTASNAVGTSAPLTLLLNVQAPANAPTVTSSQTAAGTQGEAFSYQITASNMPAAAGAPMPAGTGFTATGLPDGLALNPATGLISGSPTLTGKFVVTLTAFNDAGTSAGKALTLTVAASPKAPVIDSADTKGATAGTAFNYQIHALNTPTSYDATGRPAWLLVDTATGLLTGTPDVPGVYKVALTASNGVGTSATFLLTLTVAAADGSPVIRSALTASSQANNAFSYQIDASNGPIKTYYAVGLPGLSLDPSTGLVSGIPTIPGAYNVQIYASNAIGVGAAKTLAITITAAPGSPVIGSGPTGQAVRYSRSLTSSGAVVYTVAQIASSTTVGASYSFQIAASGTPSGFTADPLPPGLGLNPATGLISGTPTASGVYNIAISASNTIGVGASATLTLTVNPPPTAPSVTSAAAASGAVGTTFTYTTTATNTPTSYNASGLPTGLSLDSSTGAITGAPTVPGTYVATLSANNNVGTGPDKSVTFTIGSAAGAPAVTSAASATGQVGVAFSYQVAASNTATSYSASGLPPGLSLDPVAGAITGTPLTAGSFSVSLSASNGTGTSTPFALAVTISPLASAPTITSSLSASVIAGTSFLYQITASNTPGSYNIGALPDGLAADTTSGVIQGVPTTVGSYSIALSANNDSGTGATATLVLTVLPVPIPPASHLVNISARASAGTGDNVLIAGFVISGSAAKPVMIRAVGPTLSTQNVRNPLANPKLDLFKLNTKIGSNDDWGSGDAATIAATATRVGAFALPSGSTDAVILATLQPGVYTAIASGVNATTGVTLVEVYDTSTTLDETTPRVVNVSARGAVGTGENVLIGGFVVSGQRSKQYLVRAIGPGLTPLGVSGALANPMLTLIQSGTVLAQNDDWGSGNAQALAAAATSVGAGALTSGSKDAAILVTLAPGAYTVTVSGVGNTTGVGLVEVYELPDTN